MTAGKAIATRRLDDLDHTGGGTRTCHNGLKQRI